MDLKEAFYKQKEELRAANTTIRRLEKELESSRKNVAADKRVQELLSKIQGLNNKVSEVTGIMNRYRKLYENEQHKNQNVLDKIYDLEHKNNQLQWQLDCLLDERSVEGATAAEEAYAQIDALKEEVARLTARLNSDSTNTGLSTSKTAIGKKKLIPNSREKSGLKKGGQPGHEKHEMSSFNDSDVTEVEVHQLESCPECGSHNLEEMESIVKDEYDYEVTVKKVRHRFIEYKCLDCGSIVRKPYNGLVAKNQYGSTIQSMALSLMNVGFVSINRTRQILTGFTPEDITLSEGYLIKLQRRYSKKLSPFVSEIKNRLLKIPLLYWDDTVVFVNTQRACMRFYGNEQLALYTAHLHKNLDSIEEDNILPSLTDVTTVMHDHCSLNYHQGFLFRNVECIQHLERDLQKVADISNHVWAPELKELIKNKLHKRKELISNAVTSFTLAEVNDFFHKVDSLLEKAYREWFSVQSKYYSNEEKALINRLNQYKENYFAWIKDFSIPTTNNLSERSLRFVKTKDKVSGQFQSIEYASYFADIRTYLETCSRNGVNEFTALLRLTQGQPYTVKELLGEV